MNKSNAQKLYLLLLFFSAFIFFPKAISAQEEFEEQQPAANWLFEYGIPSEPRMYFRYDNYSKADTVKFREKLKLINESTPGSDWEGVYGVNDESTSFSQLRWNSKDGFIDFYIYTCLPELRRINYGTVTETPDFIELVSEKPDDSTKKKTLRYAKVKWGKNFYLVEESSLHAFLEKAVGIFVEPKNAESDDYMKWYNFVMKGDQESPFDGLPEVSAKYKHLQRSPIEAKISEIVKRAIEEEKEIGNNYYAEAVWYSVKIDAGKNKNVKVGMKFNVTETNEEVIVTEVGQNSSVGLIRRDVDDGKKETCHDIIADAYKEIPCPQIKSSLKIKTQVGKLFWF